MKVGWHRRVGLVLGPLALLVLAVVPSALHDVPGFGARPALAAGVALLMAIWWFTEAVPMAVAACVPLVLYPLLGIFGRGFAGDLQGAGAPYVDGYIFLFLGGMVIGVAMEEHQLHRRIALHIMARIGTEPKRLLLGVLLATALVSAWISNTATAVMMLPIGMALLRQLEAQSGGQRRERFGGAIMLGVAYGANVGGIGTKIGTATNSIFVSFLDKHGFEVGFLTYLAMALPFVLVFLPVVWLVLWREARNDAPSGASGREVIGRELAEMGAMSWGERQVTWVFSTAAALWIFGDPLRSVLAPVIQSAFAWKLEAKHYEASVAMLAACVLLAIGALGLASLRRLPWSTLLLLGGSFAMAAGIEGGGLAVWLTAQLAALATLPQVAQLAIAAGITVVLSAIASNSATISVMMQMLPRSLAVLFASNLAASCDFMLPAGTPPNAIVFGSGYVRLPTMMRVGFALDVLAVLAITLYTLIYVGPLFG